MVLASCSGTIVFGFAIRRYRDRDPLVMQSSPWFRFGLFVVLVPTFGFPLPDSSLGSLRFVHWLLYGSDVYGPRLMCPKTLGRV